MDPRVEFTLQQLQRHWIALAGIGVAAIVGGGFGKALSPTGLYRDPVPAQLIAAPPSTEANLDLQTWPSGRVPSYVVGTDVTDPPREVTPLPATDAAYSLLDDEIYAPPTADQAARSAESAVRDVPVEYGEAFNAAQAGRDDAVESYPPLAPG